MTKKVVIVGAGIGGLASANLLAKAGYDVHVYEKDAEAGGRSGRFTSKGFTFDTGPSWYLMPDVFEHYYNLLGTTTKKQLDLLRLKPAYKIFYESGQPLTITSDLAKDAAQFDTIEQGSGAALRRYVSKSNETYQMALKYFLYSNFEHPRDFFQAAIFKRSAQLVRLTSQSVHSYVSQFVKTPKLQQVLEYPMVFLGSSPYSAPALYSLMSALDFSEGVFYPKGTMYMVPSSLEKLGQKLGVTYHYNQPVTQILVKDGLAAGLQLQDGSKVDADIVISNADLHFTETKLLAKEHQSYSEKYWQRLEASPSAIMMYLGIKGRVPELEHHSLLFVDKWKANFEAIYKHKTLPTPASIYISKTSHTDATAPNDSENIFVLVPIPSGISLSGRALEKAADGYLDQIADMTGVDLKSRIITKTLFGPDDFKEKYHSFRSSMLGPSHKLGQSAFFRTPNKSKKVKNLYYVGASTVPGVGVPMCLISAELVYKRITGSKKGGRVTEIVPQKDARS